MGSFDWTGLAIVVAVGTFIALFLTAIDSLLLRRQTERFADLAAQWFIFFDDLRIANLPRLTVEHVGRLAIQFQPVVIISLLSIYALSFFLTRVVHINTESPVFYASLSLRLTVLVLFMTQLFMKSLFLAAQRGNFFLFWLVYSGMVCAWFLGPDWFPVDLGDPAYFPENDILTPRQKALIIKSIFFPALAFFVLVGILFAFLVSFRVFRATTCHLLELSAERKTIFAHLGVLIALLAAGGKMVLEIVKVVGDRLS